ncbi:MAG: 3-deoxy-manno-octulosonate cytidylyltransferase [Magnetococcus sp. DMHC-6]
MADKIAVIIPARYHSTRLPGKPLALLAGKPMIWHVYERASQAQVNDVLVATDDERIAQVVRSFGGHVVLTSPEHPSGTDRVAEAVRHVTQHQHIDLVVNVQGDEPFLVPKMIDQALFPLREDATIPMGTLAHAMQTPEEARNPNVVKVVCNKAGFALYFSRAAIPFIQKGAHEPEVGSHTGMLRHIGLYVYRADFLQTFAKLSPTFLEQQERLEQLRALEHGFAIRVVQTQYSGIGIDTPADLEQARQLFSASTNTIPNHQKFLKDFNMGETDKPTPDSNKKFPLPNQEKEFTSRFTRMLAGKPLDEEIIDPANPNLMRDSVSEK